MTRPMADLAETLEGLAETTGTTMIWPMAPYHGNMVDGRILLQLKRSNRDQ